MKQLNKKQSLANTIFLITISLFSIVLFNACRKYDFVDIEKRKNDKFFYVTKTLEPEIKKVYDYLRNKHSNSKSINEIIEKSGYPFWDKAFSSIENKKFKSLMSIETDEEIAVIIPMIEENDNHVNSFLKGAIVGDSVSISNFIGETYKHYIFEGLTNNNFTAEKFAVDMMLLDYVAFGHKQFQITDSALFKNNTIHYNDSEYKTLTIKDNPTVNTTQSRLYDVITICITTTSRHCTNTGRCKLTGKCDNCSSCVSESEICNSYGGGGAGVDPFYYPPSGPTNTSSGNIGGSGGGSGGPSDGGSGGLGWAPEIVDHNGFYKSRIEKLKIELNKNPELLIPCDSLNLMPLDPVNGYGSMYKEVAQHFISYDILNRVDSLSNVSVTNGDAPFNIQELDSAKGSYVNCDYFPLKISSLPFKDSTRGLRYTHTELLEYFRLNIDSFITPTPIFSLSFKPYNYGGINDKVKFLQPFDKSNGSLVHINMINNGTVIQAGFIRSISTTFGLPNSLSFTFSTIDSPLDDNHPVSGNRRFGIFKDPSSNAYTFYIMGVDRVSTNGFRTGDWLIQNIAQQPRGFEQADELWSDIQSNIIKFINKNKGGATLYTKQRIIARPRWDLAGEYLRGEIDFAALKTKMGC